MAGKITFRLSSGQFTANLPDAMLDALDALDGSVCDAELIFTRDGWQFKFPDRYVVYVPNPVNGVKWAEAFTRFATGDSLTIAQVEDLARYWQGLNAAEAEKPRRRGRPAREERWNRERQELISSIAVAVANGASLADAVRHIHDQDSARFERAYPNSVTRELRIQTALRDFARQRPRTSPRLIE